MYLIHEYRIPLGYVTLMNGKILSYVVNGLSLNKCHNCNTRPNLRMYILLYEIKISSTKNIDSICCKIIKTECGEPVIIHQEVF